MGVGQDSIVGIVTVLRAGWSGDDVLLGVKCFPPSCRLALGPTQLPVWWVTWSSFWARAWHCPPAQSGADVRVELYLCSPSGPSWPVVG